MLAIALQLKSPGTMPGALRSRGLIDQCSVERVAEAEPNGLNVQLAEGVIRATGGSDDTREGTAARDGDEQGRSGIRPVEPVVEIFAAYPPLTSRHLPLEATATNKSSPKLVLAEG